MSKKRLFVNVLGALLLISTTLLTISAWNDPRSKAITGMIWGLILLWIFFAGGFMFIFRDRIKHIVSPIQVEWKTKFILMCTILALIEEAITTTMTNLAPFFGVNMGEAYITASANYLDVVTFHSVVVFVPMFISWAWLLNRYDFRPFSVFLLFGITGTIAETISFGIMALFMFWQWIFVYGLMVYIPAYCIPENRVVVPARFWHYIGAIFFPILFAIPVAIFINVVFPNHPSIHFGS
ncbi:MAG TPA: hypothetical protein VN316_02705 [candidate division Zixibacteria bacterium]|nr:hypothetical protein [candidate division Zixibacteria bacterium]